MSTEQIELNRKEFALQMEKENALVESSIESVVDMNAVKNIKESIISVENV